jgi:hypothetical protein
VTGLLYQEAVSSAGVGRKKVIRALMKVPRDPRLKGTMSNWSKEQRSKYAYMRDKFSRSSSKRYQNRKTRLLMRTHSEPSTLPSQYNNKGSPTQMPNGILPTELEKMIPSRTSPSWMHDVKLPLPAS